MYKLIIIVTLLVILPLNDTARILCVFSSPFANDKVFRVLTEELIQRGHDLVVVTKDPGFPKNATPANLKEIDVSGIVNAMWKAEIANVVADKYQITNLDKDFEIAHNIFMRILENHEFKNAIKDSKFDLLLLEASDHSSLILSHMLKAPVVLISSGFVFNYNKMGVPCQEFLYPSVFRKRIVDMSIWEQIYDIYQVNSFERFLTNFEDVQYKSFKNVVSQDTPTMDDLYNNVELLLVNQFPLWEGIRPVPKNVIHVGGLHTQPAQDLPEDVQQYFNLSKNGVIYVSFGTVESSLLSPEKLQVLVRVLSQVPFDVLWQWENELPGKGSNIKRVKRLPQADLLRHPKVKLFITNGDLQSSNDAITAGVPVIGIPFMHDQFFNCENYIRHKIGLKLDIGTLTEDELNAAISRVATDNGYRENVVNLRMLLRYQPQASLARATWWIEHASQHSGQRAARFTWAQQHELQLAFGAASLCAVAVGVAAALCCCLAKAAGSGYRSYRRKRMDHFPR